MVFCSGIMERTIYDPQIGHNAARYRCLTDRLGRSNKQPGSSRFLEYANVQKAFKLSGTNGSVIVHESVQKCYSRTGATDSIRQYNHRSVYISLRRPEYGTISTGTGNMDRGTRHEHYVKSQTFGGKFEYPCRSFEQTKLALRMAPPSQDIQISRSHVGTPQHRSICYNDDYPPLIIQQHVSRPLYQRDRCISPTRLGRSHELREPSILLDTKRSPYNQGTTRRSYLRRTMLACTTMVSGSSSDVNQHATVHTKQSEDNDTVRNNPRTMEKQTMENYGLASVWSNHAKKLGWSEEGQRRIVFHWASSTIQSYDRHIINFMKYCDSMNISFPPCDTATLADYLCVVSNKSKRPKSVLTNTVSALISFYDGSGSCNPARDRNISMLCDGLVKSGTENSHVKTPVLPVEPIHDMFVAWPENEGMTIKQLRLKTIALLALVAMLRPSDVAPHAKLYNKETGAMDRMLFTMDQLTFEEDNSVTINFHGIKNDYNRDGFQVRITPSTNPKLDPVATLRCYIDRTQASRPATGPVFISLKSPYNGITSTTVANILNETIKLSGLNRAKYSAKSFRPTGATISIQAGCNPDIVRHVGRWKSKEVFEKHYVHSNAQDSFSDIVLKV